MDFKMDVAIVNDEIIAKPHGEIDIYFATTFKERLNKLIVDNKLNVLIDCEDLEYLDSTGLGALMSILKHANESNVKIRIINLKPNIGKLFTITGLNKIFNIE